MWSTINEISRFRVIEKKIHKFLKLETWYYLNRQDKENNLLRKIHIVYYLNDFIKSLKHISFIWYIFFRRHIFLFFLQEAERKISTANAMLCSRFFTNRRTESKFKAFGALFVSMKNVELSQFHDTTQIEGRQLLTHKRLNISIILVLTRKPVKTYYSTLTYHFMFRSLDYAAHPKMACSTRPRLYSGKI